MSNTEHVLTGKECMDTELLFEYITGICTAEVKKIATEALREKKLCVALTVPLGEPEVTIQLYKSVKAEGIDMPLLFCRYMGGCLLSVFETDFEDEPCSLLKNIGKSSLISHFTVYEKGLGGKRFFGVYDTLAKQSDREFYFARGKSVVKPVCERKRDMEFCDNLVVNADVDRTEANIEVLFTMINDAQLPVKTVKKYLADMYVDMLIKNSNNTDVDMLRMASGIGNAKCIFDIKKIFSETAYRLAMQNKAKTADGYSNLVKETVYIVNRNIGNEDLSLRWIAGNLLYTNVDYLGKIFKKETGKNFSHYVMEKRMELAKELILEGESYKIYEVAESVGFGSNSQYFSQVFKKYAGISPIEYREYAKEVRRNAAVKNNTR